MPAVYAKWRTGVSTGSLTGPSGRALLAVRTGLALGYATLVLAMTAVLAAGQWPALSMLQRTAIATSAAALAAAWVLVRKPWAPRLAALSCALLLVSALLPSDDARQWFAVPNVITASTYLAVLVLPRWWPALAIAIAGLVSTYVIASAPVSVLTWAPPLPARLLLVVHIVAGSAAVWFAWGLMRADAEAADASYESSRARITAAQVQQERARVWRRSAARLHESLLNTIRYVLSVEQVDRQRLADSVVGGEAPPPTGRLTVHQVITEAVAIEVAVDVTLTDAARSVQLDAPLAEAVRAAVVEAVRNAHRHASATRVTVEVRTAGSRRLEVSIRDDGRGSAPASAGVGTSVVLGDVVRDVGGSSRLTFGPGGSQVIIEVPLAAPLATAPTAAVGYQQGLTIVCAAMAGSSAVSGLYLLGLLVGGPVALRVAAALTASALFVAVVALIRGVRLSRSAVVLVGLLPAVTPWLLRLEGGWCTPGDLRAAALNTTGFTVVLIAAWSRRWAAAAPVVAWVAGSVALVATVPPSCRTPFLQALSNGLIIIPLLVLVAYAGARASARATAKVEHMRAVEQLEGTRASTYEEFNSHLASAAEAAREELLAIARSTGPVSREARERLQRCDSRLRAAVQVDPRASGGLGVLAADMVEAAAAAAAPITVRSIATTMEGETVSANAREWFVSIAARPDRSSAILQVIDTGDEEHMTFSVQGQPKPTTDSALHGHLSADRIDVEIVLHGDDGDWLLIARRPHTHPGVAGT